MPIGARTEAPSQGGADELGPWSPGPVERATRSELEEAGQLDSSRGQAAVALARRIDFGGEDTGASIATLAKQHAVHMAEALKDVPLANSPLDEIRMKREARRRGA